MYIITAFRPGCSGLVIDSCIVVANLDSYLERLKPISPFSAAQILKSINASIILFGVSSVSMSSYIVDPTVGVELLRPERLLTGCYPPSWGSFLVG